MTSKMKALNQAIIYLIFSVFAYLFISFKAVSFIFLVLGILLLAIHKVFDYIDIRVADIILRLFFPISVTIILLLFF